MILQTPATITKVSTMSNRTLRLQIDTQENLTDEQIASLVSKVDKYGYFCFLEDTQIDESDLVKLPPLPKKLKEEQSPAQKFRSVLYILWEQNGKKGDFELFYNRTYERLINEIKEKLV